MSGLLPAHSYQYRPGFLSTMGTGSGVATGYGQSVEFGYDFWLRPACS
jgi:hypothetical protein